ncbi:MAG: modulated transcriptional regulator, LuxR family [Amycolatopsis sp.]|uniref:LuxR C-terminal-related transcriptional regulator n=1 Tax=Amycolatopsis sp. TaxID=37632 RepID=UPI00261010EF|nr:LuxR C-terminal-related transcriptional regulator [Amycolatopsis sp.]MCU1679964.1 modulated transcriptional regulator, LuxR family [Amycolatopsis sp.]
MESLKPTSTSTSASAAVLAVVTRAEELLDVDNLPCSAEIDATPGAIGALGCVWDNVRAAMQGDQKSFDRLDGAQDLLSLALQAKDAEDQVRREQEVRQSSALQDVRAALSRFEQIQSVADLIEAVPATVCLLGFDRAIFSRIHEAMWVTETLHVEGDEAWAGQILQAGRDNPEKLVPDLFETEIVRRRRAILVTNAQERPRVHRAVSESSQSRTYVAAPVMPRSQVIGFLHGDRFFHPGPLDGFDRDLLAVFAEGFGYVLERSILLDKLAQLRAAVLDHGDGLSTLMREDGANQQRLARVPAQPSDRETMLTRRETEIVRLMAAGDTNGRIASKLVISEGTVKSHAKHILRKLGAANRAEAVSIWLTRGRAH